MKFQINSALLKKALERVAIATPKNTTIPALQGIVLEAHSNDYITLKGTNIRDFIHEYIEAEVFVPGSVWIPLNIVKALPKEPEIIKIELVGNDLNLVRPNGTKFKFRSRWDIDELPDRVLISNLVENHRFYFPLSATNKKSLLSALKLGNHCASTTANSLQGFDGLVLNPSDKGLESVSTDGNRLVVSILKGDYQGKDERTRYALDDRTTSNILKWVKLLPENGHLDIIFFENGNRRYVKLSACDQSFFTECRTIDFIDYQEYVEEKYSLDSNHYGFRFNRKELLQTIKELSGSIDTENIGFYFNPSTAQPGESYIFMTDTLDTDIEAPIPHVGKIYYGINSKRVGDRAQICFRIKYLLEMLSTSQAEEMDFFCAGDGMPGYFFGTDQEIIVIMSLSTL